MKQKSILIATPRPEDASTLIRCFQDTHSAQLAAGRTEALEMFCSRRRDYTFIDVRFLVPGSVGGSAENCRELLAPYLSVFPTADLIVLTDAPHIRDAVYLVKAGAGDYLTYPVMPSEVKFITERLTERHRQKHELRYLRDQLQSAGPDPVIASENPLMREVIDRIQTVAKTRTTVLLTGETGTGKSFFARQIHQAGHRKKRQFISVHCGAIPDGLVESELFGHEKGAFTGAVKRKLGKFEIAHEGTLFLDEIGTITPAVQIKLLKVLQEQVFQRVGGDADIRADVRLIAATNADLSEMVTAGTLRRDLYYRLNVFPVEIPPLRQRLEDISFLTANIVANLNNQYGKEIDSIDPLVMDAFRSYAWPGNIRELENLIERAYILETSDTLMPDGFPPELFTGIDTPVAQVQLPLTQPLSEVRKMAVEEVERKYLAELLTLNQGRINRSAQAAGITPRQLHKLLTKYNIQKKDFKPACR